MTAYYKWLRADNCSPIGLGTWTPDEWRSVTGKLIPCKNGLHLCRSGDLIEHISERLWTAEADESELIIHDGNKVVVRRARIIKQVETINDTPLRLFACDCAESVAHLAKDERSMAAIAVSRRYARGQATQDELDAARDAARDAASAAPPGAAAWAAAWAADDAPLAAYTAARFAAMERMGVPLNSRLLQYVKYGEAAEAMPWERATP